MVAQEYAKALFELTTMSSLKETDDELMTIAKAFTSDEDAMKVMTYPNVSAKNKKDIIENVTKNCDDLIKRFLFVLVDNNRFDELGDISKCYHDLVSNQNSIMEVEVTSKELLTEEQTNKLISALSSKYEGRKIKIKNIANPNLIGGIKIIAEGQLIDLTLRNKLNTLKEML